MSRRFNPARQSCATAIQSRLCRLEGLEDRRMLSASFNRVNVTSSDASAYAAPFVRSGGMETVRPDSSSSETIAFGGDAVTDSDPGQFASAENAIVAQVAGPPLVGGVPVGGNVFIPTVEAATQVALVANSVGLNIPTNAGLRGAQGRAQGQFQVVNAPAPGQFDFHGVLFLAAYGETNLTGDAIEGLSMGLGVSIGGAYANALYQGEGYWETLASAPGTSIFQTTAGLAVYIPFTISVSNGNVIEFSASVSTSSDASLGVGSSAGTAQSQWELVATGWGYVTPAGQDLSPGDVDGDGSVDTADLDVITSNYGWDPLSSGDLSEGVPTRASGDLNHDLRVNDADVAIWASNAPSNYILVSTANDVVDANYSFGNLSLREAVALAADTNHPGANTIVFAPSVAHIKLASELTINSDVSLVGHGENATVIDGDSANRSNDTRVLSVNAGVTAMLSRLRVTGGSTTTDGGGILNSGNLTLNHVVVAGNYAGSAGGGIESIGGTGGAASLTIQYSTIDGNTSGLHAGGINVIAPNSASTLDMLASTISNNTAGTTTAGLGGGLSLWTPGPTLTATVKNSTVSGNSVGYVGGVRVDGATAVLYLVNSTVAKNKGNVAGGVSNANNGVVTLRNSIVATNTTNPSTGSPTANDLAGLVFNSTYNLVNVSTATGITNGTNNNKVGTAYNAGLATLGNYGGPTFTHALSSTSDAIGAGKNSFIYSYGLPGDQRDKSRLVGTNVDLGSYEYNPSAATAVASTLAARDKGFSSYDISARDASSIAALLDGHSVEDPRFQARGRKLVS